MDPQALTALLADPKLSDRAKVLLVVLGQQPHTPAATLALACGHGRRKTQRTLDELISCGLVETQYHGRQVRYHLSPAAAVPPGAGIPTAPVAPAIESAHDLTPNDRTDANLGVVSAHDLTHSDKADADQAPIRAKSVADRPAPNARVRTPSISTSSSEEVPSLPPPPEEDHRLLAGSAGEEEFLACWQQLATGCPSPTAAQVAELERQTTPGAPLALVRRFLQEGRNLSRLKQPAKAWIYFARACQNQTQPARASPRQTTPRPAPGNQRPNLIDLHHQHPRSQP